MSALTTGLSGTPAPNAATTLGAATTLSLVTNPSAATAHLRLREASR